MVTKNITEQRAEVRIFAGNDPAHTATGSSGISSATPALTPLMLDEASGKLVVWTDRKPVVQLAYWYCRLKAQRRY